MGRGDMTIKYGKFSVRHSIIVADIDCGSLLGLEFLRENSCQIDLEKRTHRKTVYSKKLEVRPPSFNI